MSLRVYNTMSGKKEEFKPLVPGKVGMYVCGVTVYDYCHIGHARANIVFDIIFRYLQFSGYETTYVRNYTDVDDKIINRANERKISSQDLAEEFIQAFDEDMEALGLIKPTHQPRATEYIQQIIDINQKLIDKGMAYASGGDVYYSVDKFSDYLKLSKRNMDEMVSGARVAPGEQKHNPMDFALWKAAKEGEPSWESPWGAGRPGWHIECSAMSSSLLGDSFDIHGGGRDLIFPHHENEIAQSEGASGKPFVKYWMHNGFVNVDKEKMSKSLGNFFTIRDILKNYDAEVVRFFILSAHYRSPIDFSDHNLSEAQSGLRRFYEALEASTNAIEGLDSTGHSSQEGEKLEEKFREAMDDDFNTALAIAHLFDGVRNMNRLIATKKFKKKLDLVAQVQDLHATILRLGSVLGLYRSQPTEWLDKVKLKGLKKLDITQEEIEALIDQRLQARAEKNFSRGDEIRVELEGKGILLLDTREGTTWRLK
ncbi:cysteinyl-tRNA synthetase [Desulfuromusa kysingii]|uniref:Cysteine--tRNA ligase n=1 Tax=Desulfuromusa kysingii TaxID=37625 RepID=A0A1H4ARX9_9BACT|nr:cysteine--tRNA ligase [Desulfuromusa kysingii]SEA38715.1 cysteinyl-tRNA synthetase [Desulfuromusa kysingii]